MVSRCGLGGVRRGVPGEASGAWEVEAWAVWRASVAGGPGAWAGAVVAAGVGAVAGGRAEAGAGGAVQLGAGVLGGAVADGRGCWSSLAKGGAAASGGVGVAAGPGAEERVGVSGMQAGGLETVAAAHVGETVAAPGRSARLRA